MKNEKTTNSPYTPDMIWEEFKVTPDALLGAKILESSVYLTRKCNLKCQYCKIIKTELPLELTMEQWIEVMDILEGLGVRFVNIAGGEPTVLKGLGRLISHINNNTTLAHSIVSNSLFNDEKLKEMVDAGLKAYVASIDVMDGADKRLHDIRKSSAGMRMLERLKGKVPYLCGNIVISARNLSSVVEVTRYLSDNGIWVNVCPVIWGRGDKWESVEEADNAYRLTNEHRERLEDIAKRLVELKRNGALLLPTESYLEGLPTYGPDLSWKCYSETEPTSPSRLIVDADGSLMTCINMRGEVAKRYTVFDLGNEDTYRGFVEDWWEDAKRCQGCYWSTMVTAKQRQLMFEEFKKEVLKGNGTQG